MRVLVLPVGITVETVSGVFSYVKPDVVIALYIHDNKFMEEKKTVLDTLKASCEMAGVKLFVIPIKPYTGDAGELYDALKKCRASEIFVSGLTGSRYLLLSVLIPIRSYSKQHNANTYIITGIEGEEKWYLEPLEGFMSHINMLSASERRVFETIYSMMKNNEKIHVSALFEATGYSRALYRIIKRLEEKGLIKRERGYIEATYPGVILHGVLQGEHAK